MVTSKTLSLANFHTLAPNTVGWERHLNRLSDYHSQSQTGFPPYNIVQEGDFDYKRVIYYSIAHENEIDNFPGSDYNQNFVELYKSKIEKKPIFDANYGVTGAMFQNTLFNFSLMV